MKPTDKVTPQKLWNMKATGDKIAMVTAYDYPTAMLAERAGLDIILVGDSLGTVVLGHDTPVPVTVDDIIHHTKAVTRGAKAPMVVADMPFMSYHISREQALTNAARLIQEGGADAVKLDGTPTPRQPYSTTRRRWATPGRSRWSWSSSPPRQPKR